jgi:hypothetical protein
MKPLQIRCVPFGALSMACVAVVGAPKLGDPPEVKDVALVGPRPAGAERLPAAGTRAERSLDPLHRPSQGHRMCAQAGQPVNR